MIILFIENFFITLLVFSGRPDPQWLIKLDDPQFKTINALFTAAKSSNLTKDLDDIPSKLGYKGFLVKIGDQGSMSFVPNAHDTKELQKCLLRSAPQNVIPEQLKERIVQGIENS